MLISISRTILLTFLFLALAISVVWIWLRIWYFHLVADARSQVRDRNGNNVPGSVPKMLIGNLPEVYNAPNQLSAYHSFHDKFGEVVQIFWLWRHQISISNYAMARQILVSNQRNYQKFPPNSVLQRLFGKSVLTFTDTDHDWRQHRLLLNEVFSQKQIPNFHTIFVDYSQRLARKWHGYIQQSGTNKELNIYPELLALFLDIVGQVAIGKDFAALTGEADEFLEALKYIVYQSTQPAHQFTTWWKHLPLPSNLRLARSFQTVDDFLERLILQRQEISDSDSSSVLDLLLQYHYSASTELSSASKQEIRDNLLAIIANGHETVATSVAFSLYLLAKYPEKLARAQAEVDSIMEQGELTKAGITKLNYINGVILETLRFSPPMAGLQRISRDRDVLEAWSIPPQQVTAITLQPLHHDPKYFGEKAEEFHPERYLELKTTMVSVGAVTSKNSQRQCPFKRFLSPSHSQTKAGVCLPLTFGDGARKCLGEHFAMYEMKVTLALLLYHFDFQVAPNFAAELELGKFGLFLTTFPKDGVKMVIRSRNH